MPPNVHPFLNGIARGLAAPYLLYERITLGSPAAPEPLTVKPARLHPQAKSDWEAIGEDLKTALSRYEQAK